MNDLFKRLGKFSIIKELVESNPQAVMQIMSKCIIVKADCLDYMRAYEYYAYSPYFDIVSEGECAPNYTWTLTLEGNISAQRSDFYSYKDVKSIVAEALKNVPTKVIIREKGRGWK